MQVIFQMRYSYFGKSGWRSKASQNADKLFSEERLAKREYYLERVALASLASQTDVDFKLLVLSSKDLPQAAKNNLRNACNDIVGADRTRVIFRPPEHAGTCIRRYIHNHMNNAPYTMQVVLDDDDAVSSDFVEVMREEAQRDIEKFKAQEDYCYISQAQGLSAIFRGDQMELAHRCVPFNTQGLCLVGPTLTRRNPFSIAHKKLERNHPSRAIHGDTAYYIRTVHDTNDSRAMFSENPLRDDEMDAIVARFPLLKSLLLEKKRNPQLLKVS